MTFPTLRGAASLCLLLVLLGGCGGQSEPSGQAPPVPDQPVPGGTLRAALAGDPDTLNPLTRRTLDSGVILGICNRSLVEYTAAGNYRPALASRWSWSEDKLVLTFELRPDAKWSDGTPLTAHDVVVSYRLTTDERIASPRASEFARVSDVVEVDPHTVAFHFTERCSQQLFNAHSLSLVPAHVVEDLDPAEVASWPLNLEPVTTGPYRLARWDVGERLVLEPNPHYYGPAPYLQELVFEVVPEEAVRILKLEAGELDMLDEIPPREVARFRDDPDSPIRLYTLDGRRFGYLAYNTTDPRFADARVRNAISLAIDRNAMIEGLLYGMGDRLASPIPPMLGPVHNSSLEPHRRDTGTARQLLAEAGWADSDGDGILDRDGEPFRFELKTRTGDSVRENGALILQRNLRDVGIEVRPVIQELPTTLQQVREGDFDVYFGQFGTRMEVDPTAQFATGGRYNHARYANPRVDDLIAQGLCETDPDAANAIWHELQEILHEDQPWSYLYLIYPVVGIHRNFRECTPHAISAYEGIETWWRVPDPTGPAGR